jgi:Trk-type K+ transport system membrane component
MLLSQRELITWTGLGLFEASLHCFALCFLSILSTLRLTNTLAISWHTTFVPLYVAVGLTVHYNVILFIRLVWYVKKKSWKKKDKRLTFFLIVLNSVGIVLLFFLEYSMAEYLERSGLDSSPDERYGSALATTLTLFLGYLLARVFLVHRSLHVKSLL